MIHTILGSGGGIGTPLARELKKYTNQIRLVSRNPGKVNTSDELLPADLSDFKQVDKAIAGSEVVYVTIGFDYNLKVWQKTWPPFMQEVINSCKRHNARLVFLITCICILKNLFRLWQKMQLLCRPAKKEK